MKSIGAVQFITRAATSFLLLIAGVPRPGAAQQPLGVRVGDQIRIGATLPSGTRFGQVVIFQGATADTLWVRQRQHPGGGLYRDSVTAIHWRSIAALEVSRGHRHAGAGAVVGALLGAAASAGARAEGYFAGGPRLKLAAAFSAGGAGIGALVGRAIPGIGPWVPAQIPLAPAQLDRLP